MAGEKLLTNVANNIIECISLFSVGRFIADRWLVWLILRYIGTIIQNKEIFVINH